MAGSANEPLAILRLLLKVSETSASYNQFSLPLSADHEITLCTYFRSAISVPDEIRLFQGDNSLVGFYRVLSRALNARRYDIIHVHSPHLGLFLLLASISASAKLLPSTVYTFHNSYQNYRLRNRLMLYPIFAAFGRVVCCSKSSFSSLPRILRWLARGKIRTVQNGVDINRVDQVVGGNEDSVEDDPFTIVTVGRLIGIKQPAFVMDAFTKGIDRSSRLIFIGEGHLMPELANEAKTLGSKSEVILTGLITRNETYGYLAKANLFISASMGEGLPLAVLEAMACRCPVILSDIPPHREIANGTEFIPLIQPNDTNGFAKEIRRFQSMSISERAMIGIQCRQHVEKHFGLATMHGGYAEVYSDLLNGVHR